MVAVVLIVVVMFAIFKFVTFRVCVGGGSLNLLWTRPALTLHCDELSYFQSSTYLIVNATIEESGFD